jgi:CRP-like cAMP-binding protein
MTPAMTPAAAVPPSPVLRVAFEQLHVADHIVWRLDRRTFRRALASTAHRNLAATMDALRSVPLLKPLSEAQLGKLAYAVREMHCSRGQTLIRKGEAGDSLYFLLSGTVVCTDIGSGAAAIADVHLAAGACFGERALLLDEPRGAWTAVRGAGGAEAFGARVAAGAVANAAAVACRAVIFGIDRRGLKCAIPTACAPHPPSTSCLSSSVFHPASAAAATVTVTSEAACVLRLDRHGLTQLLGPLQDILDRNIVVGVLKSVPLLSHLPEGDLQRLAGACACDQFERGAVVLRRGAPVDCLYILREGCAAVSGGEPGTHHGRGLWKAPALAAWDWVLCTHDSPFPVPMLALRL